MKESEDIVNLFQQFGGKTDGYQELGRMRTADQARARWPLLAGIDNPDAVTPGTVEAPLRRVVAHKGASPAAMTGSQGGVNTTATKKGLYPSTIARPTPRSGPQARPDAATPEIQSIFNRLAGSPFGAASSAAPASLTSVWNNLRGGT